MVYSRKFLNGFTLIEVIVVVGLIGLIALFILGILLANNRFYNNQTGEITAISGTRQIADRIAEYGRAAVSVEAAYTYNSMNYTSGASTIIFKIPSIDSASQIIAGTYDYVIITPDIVDPARLMLFLDPHITSARNPRNAELTRNLAVAAFTYNPDIATADTAAYNIQINVGGTNPAAETITGQVTFRNK